MKEEMEHFYHQICGGEKGHQRRGEFIRVLTNGTRVRVQGKRVRPWIGGETSKLLEADGEK